MRMLSASELLGVWERGRVQGPIDQALLLLATACPDTSTDELARLSIGWRDHALLTLREWTFGRAITSVTNCPQCGEQLELEFDAAGLGSQPQVSTRNITTGAAPEHISSLVSDGYTLHFRCANSHDLAALLLPAQSDLQAIDDVEPTAAHARTALLARCILTAHRAGSVVPVAAIPDTVLAALADRMAEVDPYADLQVAASCPVCANQWNAIFDVVSYFWSEIDHWARRVLHEVHLLARAYGWSEQEILNLSPLRRQCYLDMVRA